MSQESGQPGAQGAAPADEALQFETAQPTGGVQTPSPGAMACASCKQSLATEYFEINGQVICPNCRQTIGTALASAGGKERLILATVYGGGAALVGALVWWGVRAATGYEIGLIAVAVGLLVGYAVRAGSQGRGGRRFQILAVVLTYLGITLNYVPDVIKGIAQQGSKRDAEQAAGAGKSADAPDDSSTSSSASPPAQPTQAEKKPRTFSVASLVMFIGVIIGIAAAAPFLGGASNVIGILIIGFALWEAWKVNRAAKVSINGPFRIDAAPAGAP